MPAMPDHTDPIEVLLDDLLPKLRGLDRLDQNWLLTTLLDELGVAHGVGARDDDIENMRDVGEGFVTTVALAVQRQPERNGDVYRAAHLTLLGLLEVRESLHDSDAKGSGGYSSASSPGT